MTPQEVWWRMGSRLRQSADQMVACRWQRAIPLERIASGNGVGLTTNAAVIGPVVGEPGSNLPAAAAQWVRELTDRADRICSNRITIFDQVDHDLGPEVQWNHEYAVDRPTPVSFAPGIDYRDFRIVGDAKVVWEPNRHQHLVVLARAYRLSGERRYAEKVIEHIEDWVCQCPVGFGMNWRSPLELAVRLINWVWVLALIEPSGVVTPERRRRLWPVVYRHLWEISRKYSRCSSANNHLVGEAAGVFIASQYFCSLKKATAWERQSREILLKEIERQTHDDGGHVELATGYHLFVLEFFLLAGLAARNTGNDFPREYWQRLEKMFEYIAVFAAGGNDIPMFGDCDDGYVLDLEGRDLPAQRFLAIGAALFDRADFAGLSGENSEPVFWTLGRSGYECFEQNDDNGRPTSLESTSLSASGYYLLQSGHRDAGDRISVAFDCGDLGFGSIAAHGHADALSFTLRVAGREVLVDPGTYDYFSWPQWRDYFRSTAAHNTVVVDGLNQSEPLGPFLWGKRAAARCIRWEPAEQGGTVTGEHDGYARLRDPVIHRRTVTLEGRERRLIIRDRLVAKKSHEAVMYFHLAGDAEVEVEKGNRYRVTANGVELAVTIDPEIEVELFKGSEKPILGWTSRGYHRKNPSPTLAARWRWSGTREVETRIEVIRVPADDQVADAAWVARMQRSNGECFNGVPEGDGDDEAEGGDWGDWPSLVLGTEGE